jgi:hypothetical protein
MTPVVRETRFGESVIHLDQLRSNQLTSEGDWPWIVSYHLGLSMPYRFVCS